MRTRVAIKKNYASPP